MAGPHALSKYAPPKDVDPGEVWQKLTELPRPLSARQQFRARGEDAGEFCFQVLTAGELGWVRMMSEKEAKSALGDDAKIGSLAYEEEYEQQKAYHILALACRQPDDPKFPVWPNAGAVRDNLTDDEVTVALRAYGEFRRKSGPIISELDEETMEAWLKVLQEGAGRDPLARCSGEALIDLILFLASKLGAAESATPTSSPGSPPAASSTRSGEEEPGATT